MKKEAEALTKSAGSSGSIRLVLFWRSGVPMYDDFLKANFPGLKEKPLAELDSYQRDITPNLDELR